MYNGLLHKIHFKEGIPLNTEGKKSENNRDYSLLSVDG